MKSISNSQPMGLDDWSYTLDLPVGQFQVIAWTWDTSNNLGNFTTQKFFVGSAADTTAPTVAIDDISSPPAGTVFISGVSADNVEIDRNRLLVRNLGTGQYWSGAEWIDNWSWFEPNGIENWDYEVVLPSGNFTTTAWTWDTSNNLGNVYTQTFTVGGTADTTPPVVSIDPIMLLASGSVLISGVSTDDTGIDRNRLLVQSLATGQYWTGAEWINGWSWFEPNGIENWDYELMLSEGNFTTTAWTWDTSNNLGNVYTQTFYVGVADTEPPVVSIDPIDSAIAGSVTISGTSSDNVAVDRNRLLIRNQNTGQYWNGAEWVPNWSWFPPIGVGSWSYTLILPVGSYVATAWTWDVSNALGLVVHETFQVTPTPNENESPVAVNDITDENGQPLTVAIGSSLVIDVLSNDSDDGTLVENSVVTSILEAIVNIADGTVTYTPPADADTQNPVTFTYTVQDDEGAVSNIATVTVVVTPAPNVNESPVAVNDNVDENGAPLTVAIGSLLAIDVLSNDTDDGILVEDSVVTSIPEAVVNPENGMVTYTPPADADTQNPVTFTYTVQDEEGAISNVATVTVVVTPAPNVNESPVAVNDSVDENGQPLTVVIGSSLVIDVLSNDTDDGILVEDSVVTSIPEAVA